MICTRLNKRALRYRYNYKGDMNRMNQKIVAEIELAAPGSPGVSQVSQALLYPSHTANVTHGAHVASACDTLLPMSRQAAVCRASSLRAARRFALHM